MSTRQESIATGAKPRVVIDELPGDVKVKGWDRHEVLVETGGESALSLEEADGAIRLRCGDDCRVHVPRGADLEVVAVRGDASIRDVAGAVTCGEVSGDLRLRHVGPARAEAVFGDLSAKGVDGDLAVTRVYGDAGASAVHGDVRLESVGADARVEHVSGDVFVTAGADAVIGLTGPDTAATVADVVAAAMGSAQGGVEVDIEVDLGDGPVAPDRPVDSGAPGSPDMPGAATVPGWSAVAERDATAGEPGAAPPPPPSPKPPPAPGAAPSASAAGTARACQVRAGADIVVRVPSDVGATFSVASGSGDVDVRLPDAQVERDGASVRVVVGDGAARVDLVAGAGVTLAPTGPRIDDESWREMGAQFRVMGDTWREMGDQFRVMATEFAGRMESHLGDMAGQLHDRLSHVSATLPEVLVAAGLSEEEAARISGHIRQVGERATERAHRHAERAARAVERQVEAAHRQAEAAQRKAEAFSRRATVRVEAHRGPGGHGGHAGHAGHATPGERPATKKWVFRSDDRAPEPPREPVSAEERMMVLRMLEQGKISAAEAERLLAAMAGRAPEA